MRSGQFGRASIGMVEVGSGRATDTASLLH